jgi:hypothetical protein
MVQAHQSVDVGKRQAGFFHEAPEIAPGAAHEDGRPFPDNLG